MDRRKEDLYHIAFYAGSAARYVNPFAITRLIRLYEKEKVSQGVRLELYLETVFYILAGLAWLAAGV